MTETEYWERREGRLMDIAKTAPGGWGETRQAISQYDNTYGKYVNGRFVSPDIDADLQRLWQKCPESFHPDRARDMEESI